MATYKTYTIFLVEDDELYINAIEKALNKSNALDIKKFDTGIECLENLHLNPDIIILDHILDTKNTDAITGFDLLKQIKSTHPEISIIMLSGMDDLEIRVDSLLSGAFDFIFKDKNSFERLNDSVNKIISTINETSVLNLYKKLAFAISTIFVIMLALVSVLCYCFPGFFEG